MFKAMMLALLVVALGAGPGIAGDPAGAQVQVRPMASGTGGEVGVILTAQGTIVVKFFESDAPHTVANFKKLAREGFYDGTTFHRLVPGFVIQGGDPLSKDGDLSNDGTGRSDPIPGEFGRGVKHQRGTLSMARRLDDPNSGSCQFFICLAATPKLDGQFAAFGQVIQGIEVVDKIAALANDPTVKPGPLGANPGKRAMMQKVTIEPASGWNEPATAAGTPRPAVAKPLGGKPAAQDTSSRKP
jgi:cyclophilin family peptidyl-prolyl cis-trans isomerase